MHAHLHTRTHTRAHTYTHTHTHTHTHLSITRSFPLLVTAFHTGKTLPTSQFLTDMDRIDVVMQRMRAGEEQRQEIRAYLNFAFIRNNRVTMLHLAKLLYSIPPRVRLEDKQLRILAGNCFFPHQRFFQYIGENCRSLYFPPKTTLFHAGDLFLGYFIIKKGQVIEIDLLGNVLLRGPGASVGVVSLWVGQQMKTTITHTFVNAFWVSSELFVDALQRCPWERRRFKCAVAALETRMLYLRDILSSDVNLRRHAYEAAVVNLQRMGFHFDNVPTKIRLLSHTQRRRHGCFWRICCLEHDLTNFTFLWSRLGRVYVFLKLFSCYISACLALNQFVFLKLPHTFPIIALFDAYLVLCLYVRLNTTVYIDSLAISDRKLLFRNWLRTTSFWDAVTLLPFEVSVFLRVIWVLLAVVACGT